MAGTFRELDMGMVVMPCFTIHLVVVNLVVQFGRSAVEVDVTLLVRPFLLLSFLEDGGVTFVGL